MMRSRSRWSVLTKDLLAEWQRIAVIPDAIQRDRGPRVTVRTAAGLKKAVLRRSSLNEGRSGTRTPQLRLVTCPDGFDRLWACYEIHATNDEISR